MVALVDDVDADLAAEAWYRGLSRNTSYLRRRGGRSNVLLLHREVMGRALGRSLLARDIVDHVNGNGLDNRRANLRLATARQNGCNRCSARGSSSRYLGVYLDAARGKWRAKAKAADGKYIHLGRFDSEADAARAYNAAALKLHGAFARLNVIELDRPCLD